VLAACGGVELGVNRLTRTCLFLAEKAWNGCRTAARVVCSGLACVWARVKTMATSATAMVNRGFMAAVAGVRNAVCWVWGLAAAGLIRPRSVDDRLVLVLRP